MTPKKILTCGCTIGLYSNIEQWCDRHYQQMLDERYVDDNTLCSLSRRVLKEDEERQKLAAGDKVTLSSQIISFDGEFFMIRSNDADVVVPNVWRGAKVEKKIQK